MSYDCYCDYDPPVFYRAQIRTARKSYRCYDCSGPILAGEKYEHVAAKWDSCSGIDRMRTCERCYDIRVWLKNNLPCFCYAHGGLSESAEDAIDDARWRASDEIRGVKFGYLRRVVLRDRFHREHSKPFSPCLMTKRSSVTT